MEIETRDFHQVMKARKTRSSIIKIKDPSGVRIDDAANIQKLFVNDFTSRFKSMHGPSSIMIDLPTKVSLEDNMNLIEPCLLFADDSFLFYRTNLQSCQTLSALLSDSNPS